jgi:transposase
MEYVKRVMPKRFHLERPDLAKEVAAALAHCQNVKDQQRLLAMRLAAGGQMTSAQIAEQLGISRRQFFNWVNALKAGGVAALLERERGGGAPARIQGPLREQLLAGLRKGQWKRAKEIQAWLKHEHQTSISLKGVYYWLGKLGGVLKVPRKTHAEKNAARTAEFQQTLCARLKNLSVAGGKPVRIWVADEHRYGLIPMVRRCWSLRGLRPVAPYRTKYEWSYLYSALEVDGKNAAEFLCLPGVSLEMSYLFLAHLSAQDPQAEHVVIWDQAGFHPRAGAAGLPSNIHLLPLPPHSPELNPVEIIGDLIKDRIANTLWKTFEALEESISEELRPLCQSAERVRSLVSHPWLMEQV